MTHISTKPHDSQTHNAHRVCECVCVLECSWAPALPLELSQPEGGLRRQLQMPAVEVLCGAASPAVSPSAVSPSASRVQASHLASVLVLLVSCAPSEMF